MNRNLIKNIEKKFFKNVNRNNIGLKFFNIGIFLLPCVFAFSVIFLLLAILLSPKNKKDKYFEDYWNYPLIISTILILISALLNTLSFSPYIALNLWSKEKIIVDLFNWIPFFYMFWSFSSYLSTKKLRRNFAIIIIAGSFPIFISGFYQLFLYSFNSPASAYGPYQIFNGLIIWYQRHLNEGRVFAITSIFSNPNYLGCWLVTILPFSIALFSQKNQSKNKRIITLLFLILISFFIFLSNSRSSIGLLFLSIPLTIGVNTIIIVFTICISITFLLMFISLNNNLQLPLEALIPKQYIFEFSPEGALKNPYRELRIDIWLNAINFIKIDPFFGNGAGLFPILYIFKNQITSLNWVNHTHNLIIELAFNYGLPVALTILIFILFLIIKSFLKIKKTYKKDFEPNLNIFNKAWWASSVVLFISQLVDIQYYDGRISLVFWILLSGLRSIIKEETISN